MLFLVKTAELSGQGGQVRSSVTIMKWANAFRVFKKKNSPKPNAASCNNVSRYTDSNGFLEHSPSRESLYYKGSALQNIIPGFLGSNSYIISICLCIRNLFNNFNIDWPNTYQLFQKEARCLHTGICKQVKRTIFLPPVCFE